MGLFHIFRISSAPSLNLVQCGLLIDLSSSFLDKLILPCPLIGSVEFFFLCMGLFFLRNSSISNLINSHWTSYFTFARWSNSIGGYWQHNCEI